MEWFRLQSSPWRQCIKSREKIIRAESNMKLRCCLLRKTRAQFLYSNVISLLRCCGFVSSLFGFRLRTPWFLRDNNLLSGKKLFIYLKGQYFIPPRFFLSYQFHICFQYVSWHPKKKMFRMLYEILKKKKELYKLKNWTSIIFNLFFGKNKFGFVAHFSIAQILTSFLRGTYWLTFLNRAIRNYIFFSKIFIS